MSGKINYTETIQIIDGQRMKVTTWQTARGQTVTAIHAAPDPALQPPFVPGPSLVDIVADLAAIKSKLGI